MNGGRVGVCGHGVGRFVGCDRGNDGGRGRGRGRGGGNDKFINGVDISDPNIFLTYEEWENLPSWERCDV